jgi:uncharacterized protein YdcH (DUF465 family)
MTIIIPKDHFVKVLEHFKILLNEASELEEWVYSNEENEDIPNEEWESNYQELKTLKSKMDNCYSMFSCVDLLDNKVQRKENEQYDVTKICVNETTYEEMKEHDRNILGLKSIYSEQRNEKEVSMLHFMSGFCVDNSVGDFEILLKEGYLRV